MKPFLKPIVHSPSALTNRVIIVLIIIVQQQMLQL